MKKYIILIFFFGLLGFSYSQHSGLLPSHNATDTTILHNATGTTIIERPATAAGADSGGQILIFGVIGLVVLLVLIIIIFYVTRKKPMEQNKQTDIVDKTYNQPAKEVPIAKIEEPKQEQIPTSPKVEEEKKPNPPDDKNKDDFEVE